MSHTFARTMNRARAGSNGTGRLIAAICSLFAALGFAQAAFAQAVAPPPIAIINARIETVTEKGAIPSGTLVMRGERIIAVGASVAIPDGAKVIDAKGGVVAPGMIAPSTNVMVDEVNLVPETRDDAGGDRIGAGFDVQYGINPASPLVRVGRQSGLTEAVITPLLGRMSAGGEDDDEAALTGGGDGSTTTPTLFGGQAAVVRLTDDRNTALVKAHAAVALDLGEAGAAHAGGSRGAALVYVRAALDDARHFAKHRADFDRGDTRSYGLAPVDLEALIPVTEGRTPLLVRVDRASDIQQALRLAREQRVKIILESAREGWMVADEIARAHVPVLLDAQADLPNEFESLGARLDNAARLDAAGVVIAMKAKRDFNSLRPIRLNAGTAVAYGLPYQAALRSVTLNPARIWGIDARTGSLEVGKDANVVLWTADPLETASYPLAVFIQGVEQANTSRRLRLRDRYLAPDDGYPPAYH